MNLLSSELSRNNITPTNRQTERLSNICDHIGISVRYHDGHIDGVTTQHIKNFADLVVRKIDRDSAVRFRVLLKEIKEVINNSESQLRHVDLLVDENFTIEDVGLKSLKRSANSFSNRIIAEIATEAQEILARPTTWHSESFPDAAPMLDSAIKLLGLLYTRNTPVLDILLSHVCCIISSDPDGGTRYINELREYVFKKRMKIRGE